MTKVLRWIARWIIFFGVSVWLVNQLAGWGLSEEHKLNLLAGVLFSLTYLVFNHEEEGSRK